MNQLIQHIIVQDQDGQASAKNSSKLNKFLHSEANQLIQHIIVQDQDGQNNNITEVLFTIILYFIIFSKHKERLIVSE